MLIINKLKVLSLFSGIGAFEKALEKSGIEHELTGFSEIDEYAITSYCAIHNVDISKSLGDVSKIAIEDVPYSDLVTYGFPCTDISLAGLQKGIIKGETRSGLLFEALRIIEAKKPQYAIAENVKNLVGVKFKDDFDALLKHLDEIGYNNYWKVLNSKNYGVPQSRERVFIVSIRKDIDINGFEFPEVIDNGVTIKDILDKEIEKKYYIKSDRVYNILEDLKEKDIEKYSQVVNNTILDISQAKREGVPRIYNNVCCTLTARDYKDPRMVIEKTESDLKIRKLSPSECFKLMGFSVSDYDKARQALIDTHYNGKDRADSQLYKQAGNSIVVDVLVHIYKNLLTDYIIK